MEKPILFSTSMVKAILDGRKTQTRRVVKNKIFQQWVDVGFSDDYIKLPENIWNKECQYQPGDTLWVRETWAHHDAFYPNTTWKNCYVEGKGWTWVDYKATATHEEAQEMVDVGERWKPSIHMPRWAARLFLNVKDVRVERLWAITEEDARAEGCVNTHGFIRSLENVYEPPPITAREAFTQLWNSLNEKRGYGWEKNPWIWRVEFERKLP